MELARVRVRVRVSWRGGPGGVAPHYSDGADNIIPVLSHFRA